ncbi:TetR/AcrR family transcriptional regulator [Curtobacterium sp. UCD-KPL2560]|uniref:TetR/AcrR family transcriptional regulator n=1 Tax=Curtobacterium sp. UCD-KPL2560 TaxID=1885315 RepID=UPI000A6D93F0|nr:TetR/AcrR family transcriptional regulator [Curtobacterium sp. UCD-KPL2560]
MNRRQAAMAASRDAIIAAAGAQFARYGYEATSFARIAEAMGRPKSAIGYHLFPSKHALAVAVIEEQQVRWTATVTEASDEPAGVERLTRVLLDTALETRERPGAGGAVRLLRELLHTDVEVPRGFVWVDFIREQLDAARSEDAPPLPDRAEELLLEATFGLVTSSVPTTTEDLVDRLRALWVPLLTSFGIPDAADRVASVAEAATSGRA